jgi:hypothetical protein
MTVMREALDVIWEKKKGKKGARGLLQAPFPPACLTVCEPPNRHPGNPPRRRRRVLSAVLGPPLLPASPLSHRRPPPPLAALRP